MKRYKLNSRRNPWRNTREIRTVDPGRLCGILLMLFMPVMIISIAFNASVRYSGTYDFNFSSTQILSHTGMSIDQDELCGLFEDYMMHKTDEFQLLQDVEYNPRPVFSEADQTYIRNIRKLADRVLIAGIPATVITAICFALLIRMRRKEEHLRFFKYGARIFLAMTALLSLCKLITPLYEKLIEPIKGSGYETGDALVTILGAGIQRTELLFELIISMVIFGILAYITHETAGRKKIFGGF